MWLTHGRWRLRRYTEIYDKIRRSYLKIVGFSTRLSSRIEQRSIPLSQTTLNLRKFVLLRCLPTCACEWENRYQILLPPSHETSLSRSVERKRGRGARRCSFPTRQRAMFKRGQAETNANICNRIDCYGYCVSRDSMWLTISPWCIAMGTLGPWLKSDKSVW